MLLLWRLSHFSLVGETLHQAEVLRFSVRCLLRALGLDWLSMDLREVVHEAHGHGGRHGMLRGNNDLCRLLRDLVHYLDLNLSELKRTNDLLNSWLDARNQMLDARRLHLLRVEGRLCLHGGSALLHLLLFVKLPNDIFQLVLSRAMTSQ